MVAMVKKFLFVFWSFLKYPVYVFIALLVLLVLSCLFFFCRQIIDGNKLKKGAHRTLKKVPLLKKIFIDAPRQYIQDLFDSDPDAFKYQGLVLYTGRQGMGKTVAMVHDILEMQAEYPLCKCITNLAFAHEDAVLSDWHQLIEYKNGIYGVIVAIDEIQNWFSSKQSKDFPPEMFEVVTQNRKNRRCIVATTQNFYQPAKDIRAQCTEVRKCLTFAGVFTLVHRVRPVLDSNGDVKEWKHIGFYCFAHNKTIRESYDTYKVIESLMKSGFKEREPVSQTNIYISKDKKNRLSK